MPMKLVISAGALFLLLGTIAPAYAQGEQHEKEQGKPEQGQQQHQQQPAQQQHQPAQQQHQQQPAQQQHQQQAAQQSAAKPVQRSQPAYGGVYHGNVRATEPTNGGVHPSGVPQHQGQVRTGFVQSRASSWNNEHRTWQQRGGYNGYRVPDDRFRIYFGNNHHFLSGSRTADAYSPRIACGRRYGRNRRLHTVRHSSRSTRTVAFGC